ncbi:MAG: S8 family serine peptidase [Sedimentisphaerales bacterium]
MKKLFIYKYSLITSLLLAIFYSNVYALQGSTAENGSNAQAVHELGITGRGINVGLISARNVRDTHEAFKDKDPNDSNNVHVFNFDYSGSDVNYMGGSVPGHDTWVAGIIASRGWTGRPNDIGVSPDCNLYSARVVNDSGIISTDYVEDALEALINTYNCRVFVTAIALSGDANGSSPYSLMYDYFAYTNNVVFALASGNGSTHPYIFGDAYNGITTAALIDEPNDYYLRVGSLSNPGPTVDGRKKPEISCPGSSQTTPSIGSDTASYTTVKDGATSFCVPQTGGVAALLLEYADQTTSEPNDGRNEVIKAVIVNSTFPNIKNKAGNPTYPADPNNVWHPQRGYGRIDALRALETLDANRIIRNTTITASAGWAYDTMSSKATHIYSLEGRKNERLILTVTWHRDVTRSRSRPSSPWEYKDEEPNKFNIDITIKDPCDMVVYSETNSVNNLEKVDLILSDDGNYTVLLTNTTSKSRDYGLAFEILPPLTGDFDMNYIVNGLDLYKMAFDWLNAGPDTDIVPDGIVNWLDFARFADNWLKTDARYYNP